jgi:hypothetical protein
MSEPHKTSMRMIGRANKDTEKTARAALTGGKGTIVGGMLGVLIIGVLDNGLILTSVPTFFQMRAKGVLLIAAGIIAEQQAGHSPMAWRLQGYRGSSRCKSLA